MAKQAVQWKQFSALADPFMVQTVAKRGTTVKLVISHSGKIARGVCVPLDQLYNLKTLNVTARMIDMALSNVLYELIDKSIPAKPLGHWEGRKKVRECSGSPGVASQNCVHAQRDIGKLGETLKCCLCARVHVYSSNGTSAELLLSFLLSEGIGGSCCR